MLTTAHLQKLISLHFEIGFYLPQYLPSFVYFCFIIFCYYFLVIACSFPRVRSKADNRQETGEFN